MTWKQSKCSLIEERIKEMRFICTTECYSAIKRNKVGLFVETWMDLKTAIHEEKKINKKYCILPHICRIQKKVQIICKAEIEK